MGFYSARLFCYATIAGMAKKELDKRIADYDAGKLTTRDWKNVHNEIRKQYK